MSGVARAAPGVPARTGGDTSNLCLAAFPQREAREDTARGGPQAGTIAADTRALDRRPPEPGKGEPAASAPPPAACLVRAAGAERCYSCCVESTHDRKQERSRGLIASPGPLRGFRSGRRRAICASAPFLYVLQILHHTPAGFRKHEQVNSFYLLFYKLKSGRRFIYQAWRRRLLLKLNTNFKAKYFGS